MSLALNVLEPHLVANLAADRGRHGFLGGGDKLSDLIRDHAWAQTPLGPLAAWPQSLRSAVDILLGSRFPMFLLWSHERRIIYNDAYAAILQAKHPAALGARFEDVWAEILGDVQPLIERALHGESIYMENLPLTMHRKGFDEQTWFTFSYSPVRDESGQIAGVFCACTETTPMVLAEHAQRSEQERLERLFQQAPGFIAVMRGPEHVFELTNEAFVQLTGQRQAAGRRLVDVMPELVEQGLLKVLDEVFSSGKPYIGRSVHLLLNRHPDAPVSEAWVDFVYEPLLDPSGRVSGVFVQGHDVTARHRAEEALQLFSDSIPAMAWMAAPDGRVERLNAQWRVYTGQPVENALGFGWADALHPDDRAVPWALWQAARDSGQPWQGEYRLRGSDGTYRWFMTRAVAQRESTGRIVRWFGTTTDIDDAKRSQEALNEADRQKDEFLAVLAHELRNPLAPIRMAAHVLSSREVQPATLQKSTDVIKRQVSHMARLLDDLLDVARITKRQLQLKKGPVALDQLVAMAVETARPLLVAKQHALNIDLPEAPVVIEADPVRLSQVLSNLLNNAAKYTDPSGRITLSARVKGQDCTLWVQDTGIGLSSRALTKVFAIFAQETAAIDRAEGGLGIGLALVKGLVELHGGTVQAESEGPGLGSTFTVHLPGSVVAAPELPESALPPTDGTETARPQQPGCKVLIADDNSDTAESLSLILAMAGHATCVAMDGGQALAMAEREKPDVMVLDIGMPTMNGYELAARVRQEAWGQRCLLVVATGWGQENDKSRAQAAGFDVHLTKPFDPHQLLELIGHHRKA